MGFGISYDEDAITKVMQLTDGHGQNGVIITAATPSDELFHRHFSPAQKAQSSACW